MSSILNGKRILRMTSPMVEFSTRLIEREVPYGPILATSSERRTSLPVEFQMLAQSIIHLQNDS